MNARLRTWAGSYSVRIALGYVLAASVIGVAWLWNLYGPLSASVIVQQQEHLRGVAQAGAMALSASPDAPANVAQRLVAGTRLRATIVAADGTVLADTEQDPSGMENHLDRPEVRAALSGGVGVERRTSETLGEEYVYVAVPTSTGTAPVAFRVSEPVQAIRGIAADWRRNGLLLLVASLLAGLAIAARITARATASVSRLAEAADGMAAGNLATVIAAEPGELNVLSTALSDLGGQMRARLEELESEQRNLRSVLDGLTDVVFLLQDGRIRYANRAADMLFHRPYGGWRDRALTEAGLPSAIAQAVAAAHGGRSARSEETGPDPLRRFFRVTTVPLEVPGQPPRLLVAVADITERARLDRMRRDFVANASHELKTPTAAIQLLAEAAATAARDGDAAQATEFTLQIEGEAARLRRLVLDLLDLSRIEDTPATGAISDLRAALDQALASHRRAAEDRGLSLELEDRAPGEDLFVTADPTDLAVAFDNLLDNAVSYTETGGVTVALGSDADEVTVAVTDTGLGIPAEDLPRIFERFYRVDRARSRDSGGTGLGLALVKHAAEHAGGSVTVSSEPGRGSTFVLRFPRAR